MTDDEVLDLAAADGFDLREVVTEYDHRECWGWVRYGDDYRWPAFGERRQAISWMRDRLRRTECSVRARDHPRTRSIGQSVRVVQPRVTM